jgi:hypothetical protein
MADASISNTSATVLQAPKHDAIDLAQQFRAENQAGETAKAKAAAAQKKARDDAYANLYDIAPEATFEGTQDKLGTMFQDYRGWVTKQYNSGADASDPRFQEKVKNMQDVLKLAARKGTALEKKIEEAYTVLDGNKFMDGNEQYDYRSALLDVYTNDDGTPKEFNEWDLKDVDAVLNNTSGYNYLGAFTEQTENYGEAVKYVQLRTTDAGQVKTNGEIDADIWETTTQADGRIIFKTDKNNNKIHKLKNKDIQGWYRTNDKMLDQMIRNELDTNDLKDTPENVAPIMERWLEESGISPKDAQTTGITTKNPNEGGGDPEVTARKETVYDSIKTAIKGAGKGEKISTDAINSLLGTGSKINITYNDIGASEGKGHQLMQNVSITYPKFKDEYGKLKRLDVDGNVDLDLTDKGDLTRLAGIYADAYNSGVDAKFRIDKTDLYNVMVEELGIGKEGGNGEEYNQ